MVALSVAMITSEPHVVFRSQAMIRRWSDDDVMVNLAIRGRTVVSQEDRDAVLRPGDFTVHDSARPCRIAGVDPFRMLVLKVPRDVFTAHCALPPGATAVRVASGVTLVALGLLLFFGRDWWLQVALDQVFTRIGLGTL